jgi:histone arginine demethylase JMJD6
MVSKSVSAQKVELKKYKSSKYAKYDSKIKRTKLKCRSGNILDFIAYICLLTQAKTELDLFKWQQWKFHQKDYWIDSFVDNSPRIDYRFVSKREFIDNFEAKNIPVVITNVTDDWKANKHWTEEVEKLYVIVY